MKLLCLLGFHKMEVRKVTDASRDSFTTHKYIYVQCTRCKEVFQ